MPRYIKYLSRNELREKINHLGFTGAHAENFAWHAGEIVVVDSLPLPGDEGKILRLLARENVHLLSSSEKILLGFDGRDKIDTIRKNFGGSPEVRYIESVGRAVEHINSRHKHIIARGKKVEIDGKPPLLMGIVNVTPDSFSDGGEFFQRERAIERGLELISDGADIVDIGGESTRPGAEPVGEEEETERIIPVIEDLAGRTDALLSVDTYKSAVAREALKAGAHMINDVSGLGFSGDMADVASQFGAAVIIMHMKGTPANMQEDPRYKSAPDEILEQLGHGIKRADRAGVKRESILVDPGVGFGKRYRDNLYIIKNLEEFRSAGYPVVVGVSRKAFIGRATGKSVDDRAFGTAAAVAIAVNNGADVLRVHDVKESRDAVLMAWEIRREKAC